MDDRSFIFFYFMNSSNKDIPAIINNHIKYWDSQRIKEYQGGPFEDKSGGLIVFKADSLATAQSIIDKDPFLINNCLESYWIKQWLI